jgi:type IV secretion system protein TrbL
VAGTARGGAALAGGARASYAMGSMGKSGAGSVAGGMGGVGKAAAAGVATPLRRAASSLQQSYREGGQAAIRATGGKTGAGAPAASGTSSAEGPPAWARRMKTGQSFHHGTTAVAHTLRSGDRGGGGASVDLSHKD